MRNGRVIFTTERTSFQYRDEDALKDKLIYYYRVDIVGEEQRARLFTNPIFVSFK